MQITVKLFAMYRTGRFKEEARDYPAGIVPGHIASALGIAPESVGIVLVNGRHASLDHPLAEGDTLSLFPLVGGG